MRDEGEAHAAPVALYSDIFNMSHAYLLLTVIKDRSPVGIRLWGHIVDKTMWPLPSGE